MYLSPLKAIGLKIILFGSLKTYLQERMSEFLFRKHLYVYINSVADAFPSEKKELKNHNFRKLENQLKTIGTIILKYYIVPTCYHLKYLFSDCLMQNFYI